MYFQTSITPVPAPTDNPSFVPSRVTIWSSMSEVLPDQVNALGPAWPSMDVQNEQSVL